MGSAARLTNSLLPVEIVQSHDKIVLAHLDGGLSERDQKLLSANSLDPGPKRGKFQGESCVLTGPAKVKAI
jgi:hypothetical protein